jgi:hypothetical protein
MNATKFAVALAMACAAALLDACGVASVAGSPCTPDIDFGVENGPPVVLHTCSQHLSAWRLSETSPPFNVVSLPDFLPAGGCVATAGTSAWCLALDAQTRKASVAKLDLQSGSLDFPNLGLASITSLAAGHESAQTCVTTADGGYLLSADGKIEQLSFVGSGTRSLSCGTAAWTWLRTDASGVTRLERSNQNGGAGLVPVPPLGEAVASLDGLVVILSQTQSSPLQVARHSDSGWLTESVTWPKAISGCAVISRAYVWRLSDKVVYARLCNRHAEFVAVDRREVRRYFAEFGSDSVDWLTLSAGWPTQWLKFGVSGWRSEPATLTERLGSNGHSHH